MVVASLGEGGGGARGSMTCGLWVAVGGEGGARGG